MIRPEQLLCPTPKGLYCPPGDFYVDPVVPVDRAVITHGHADHARSGHGTVLATPATLDIMATRYGEDFARTRQAASYGETVSHNGVEYTANPTEENGTVAVEIVTELSTWDGFAGGVDPVYKPVVAFAVLIVVLLARPQGLLGRARLA